MSFHAPASGPDYYPCRYGGSATVFRGPRSSTTGDYIAVLGSSEVYGRYVEDPFCDQLAERTGRHVVNLGVVNGGVDVFVRDEEIMKVVAGAAHVVVQVMGAANLSNRFFTVHPRRNDRFVRHSAILGSLFPQVDFTDFAFTRHMLVRLLDADPLAFDHVRQELRAAWIARMRLLLGRIPCPKTLLLIERPAIGPLGPEPLFIDPDMLHALDGLAGPTIHCATAMTGADDLDRMVVPAGEQASAGVTMGPDDHARIAGMLALRLAPKDAGR